MASAPLIGPQTIPVYGQNVAAPYSYAFAPGNAVGPIPSGAGQAPLATLPPGASASYGAGGGAKASTSGGMLGGSLGGISVRTLLILAGLFLAGLVVLEYVHWRP